MAAAEQEQTTPLGYCLVTGGAGLLGRNLAQELLRRGERVRVFDRVAPPLAHARLDVVIGDVTDFAALRAACVGIDTVFHTVAVLCFLSRPRPEERELSQQVNVGGVRNLIRACREAGVKRLVHTSSNNVTFHAPVIDGDESRPYATSAPDLYTQTKILGEQAVLEANGRDGLLTCAIRPGGIYGPGDSLILPRVVEQCARGRFKVLIGDPAAKSDNTFVDNLVDGEIEAARHLLPESPLGSQAYFITDGNSINYFEFFRPLVEGMGFGFPRLRIPAWPIYGFAWLAELGHRFLGTPVGLFTLHEAHKFTISHYNRIDKAKRDFGWEPKISPAQAMERSLAHCKKLLAGLELVERPAWYWWILIPAGMALLGLLAISAGAHAWWSAQVTTLTPRSLLAAIFVWASLLHVYKGMKAVRLAERAGLHKTSMGWGWQTFLLGFASLGLLERRVERARGAAKR